MDGMDSEWRRLPESVRLWVAGTVGGRVLGFDPSGEANPGEVVGVVRSIRGPLVLRAVPADSPGADHYRFAARVTMALPEEVPAAELVRAGQSDGWIVLIFEEPDGRAPAQPWRAEELARVTGLLDELTPVLTPSPIEGLPVLADGDTLLHFDLHPGTVRLPRRGQPTVLDWGSACTGPAWADTVRLLVDGDLGSLDPEQIFLATARGSRAPAAEVDALLEHLAYTWGFEAEDPATPESLRARRAASALAATRWLQQRRG